MRDITNKIYISDFIRSNSKFFGLFVGLLLLISFADAATTCTNTTSGVYNVFTCTGVGTVTWRPIIPAYTQVLIVAGGGGGGGGQDGYAYAGGGGAGGWLNGSIYATGSYTITVGAGGTGGAAGPSSTPGTNGTNSSLVNGSNSFIAFGGGGGGRSSSSIGASAGFPGGSGGGAGGAFGSLAGGATTQIDYSPMSGDGNAGGSGNGTATGAGGGGGAGSAGGTATRGSGKVWINGVTYAEGGYPNAAGSPTANTGDGGTGFASTGGPGADGTVILYIQYPCSTTRWVQNESSGSVPLNIQFTDASTLTQTAWNWSFGDGTYSNSQNPTHVYSTPGVYNVSLNTTNNASKNNLSTYYKCVVAGQAPQTNPSYQKLYLPFNGTNGTITIFDSSISNNSIFNIGNASGCITTSQSKFGGSAFSFVGSNDAHLMIPYNISLALGNNNFYIGWWENDSSIIVGQTILADRRYNHSFNYIDGILFGYAPNGTAKLLYGANLSTWDWVSAANMGAASCKTWNYYAIVRNGTSVQSWKDGVLQSNTAVVGKLNNTSRPLWLGTYQSNYYSMSVSDKDFIIDDFVIYNGLALNGSIVPTRELLVNPTADFIASNISGQFPIYVNFTDASLGDEINWWNWSFGDGTYSSSQNPNHQYTNVGNYSVTLNVSNQFGWDNITRYVNVTSRIIADFTSNVTSAVQPADVQFTDQSINATGWSWFFGDEDYKEPWVLQNASPAWGVRYGNGIAALPNGKLVLTGGLNVVNRNDTWISTDEGVIWTLQNPSSGWSNRRGMLLVSASDGTLILAGGVDNTSAKNDTWVSQDEGVTWTLANASGGWQPRDFFNYVITEDDEIIIIGGRSGATYYGDTWRSLDKGLTWSLVNASCAWTDRAMGASGVLSDGTIIFAGGTPDGTAVYNDTWISSDGGKIWTLVNASSSWAARRATHSVVINDKMIIMGGLNGSVVMNDSWMSSDSGTTWSVLNISNGWAKRYVGGTGVLPNGKIVLAGGTGAATYNDVWILDTIGSSDQNPIHTYPSFGFYNVSLQVYNTFSYNKTQKANYMTIYNNTISGFTANVTTGVAPLAVGFNVTVGNDNATQWNWSFGDGTWQNGTTQNATHVYTLGGIYTITEIASNIADSNTTTRVNYLIIYNETVSGFTANVTTGVEPLAIGFNVTNPIDNATQWNWSFGDGTWQNATSTEVITNGGFETGDVTGWGSGTSGSGSVQVWAGTGHTGTYSANLHSGPSYINQSVNLTNVVAIGWWDKYVTNPGTITVSIDSTEIYSGPGAAAYAYHTISTVPYTGVHVVNFSFNGAVSEGCTIDDISALRINALQNVTHVYSNGGIYTVIEIASNPVDSNTTTMTDYITVYNKTISGFTANVTNGSIPHGNPGETASILFNVTKGNDNATQWNWSFGDGNWTNGTTQNVTYTYLAPGNYTVIEIASNPGDSNTTTMVDFIHIYDHIIPEFTANVTYGIYPLNVGFNVTNPADGASMWNWSFGDGTWQNGTTQNATHVYTTFGVYTVMEIASNPGDSHNYTLFDYISVYNKTISGFSANVTSGVYPLNVGFNVTNPVDNATQWNWSFGDGDWQNGTNQNATHVYLISGIYTVTEIASNPGDSNTTTLVDYITVGNTTITGFTANVTSGVEPLAIGFNVTNGHDNATQWNWSFGDGTWQNGTTQNATHVYSNGGIYTVIEIATNSFGGFNSTTLTDYITIYNKTLTGFAANVTSGVEPLHIEFNVTNPVDNATQWNWSFGDGIWQNGTNQNATHIYSNGGIYTVIEIASNPGDSNTTTLIDYITVHNKTITGFNANVTSGIEPFNVGFNVTNPVDNATQWNWSFGDGIWQNGTNQNATHIYSNSGIYTIIEIASNDGDSNTTTLTDYITVYNRTISGFTANVTIGTEPLAVGFNVTTVHDNATRWNWSFGDGTLYNGTTQSLYQNVSHVYSNGGIYTVIETAQDGPSFNTTTRIDYITIHNQTFNTITANVTTGYIPLPVLFTSTNENATMWNWSINDTIWYNGTTSFSYNFVSDGNYTVNLTTSEDGYGVCTTTQYINATYYAPSTSFTASPLFGSAPLSVTFTDTSANGPVQWNWSFGDGTWQNGSIKNASHTYNFVGIYTVTLYTSNAYGETNFSLNITVLPLAIPIAQFSVDTNVGAAPLDVIFTDTSYSNITDWYWDFGDGTTDTNQSPLHTFTNVGTYNVKLTVTNDIFGVNTSQATPIYVVASPIPVVDFIGSPTTGSSPLTVQFTDLSAATGGITGWNWSFGDGNYSNDQNPSHDYVASGQYSVTLIASSGALSNYTSKIGYINVGIPSSVVYANFTATPLSTASCPASVQFTDLSVCNPVCNNWAWDFNNDGAIESSSKNPSYVYSYPGVYTVKLLVSNGLNTGTKVRVYYITIGPVYTPTTIPQPTGTWDPGYHDNDTSFSFKGDMSIDLANSTYLKYWLQHYSTSGNFSIYGFSTGIVAPLMHVFGFWIFLIIWGLYLFAVWIRSQDVTLPLIIGVLSMGTFGLLFPKESLPVIIIMFVICGAIIVTKLLKDNI